MSEATLTLPLEIQIAALNRSTQEVFYLLRNKTLKANDIQQRTTYSSRTIRSALRTLLDLNLVKKIPNLQDLRSCYYTTVTPL